jgi:hypothetical protein
MKVEVNGSGGEWKRWWAEVVNASGGERRRGLGRHRPVVLMAHELL